MAIYLDANVLWPWVRLNEPERLAVSIVAHQLGQEVLVPEIAVLEAEAELRRRLEEELGKIRSAESGLARLMGQKIEIFPEPMPDVDDQLATWRSRLTEFATILSLTDADARHSLEREIEGRLPARPREKGRHGAGGRDTAVWLTVLRDHCERGEPGHLLSADKKAFSDARGNLHPDLVREAEERGGLELSYHKDSAALVARLGRKGPRRDLSLAALRELAFDTIQAELEDSSSVPRALWSELDPELRYRTEVKDADLLEILSQHRYVVGERAVVAVNSRWRLTVTTWWQRRETDQSGTWAGVSENEIEAELQLLVEEDAEELSAVEVIGAEVNSEVELSMMEDGSIVSIGPARTL